MAVAKGGFCWLRWPVKKLGLSIGQFGAGADHGFAVANGIERYADVGRELPWEFLVKLLWERPDPRSNMIARRGIGVNRADSVGQEVGHVEDARRG